MNKTTELQECIAQGKRLLDAEQVNYDWSKPRHEVDSREFVNWKACCESLTSGSDIPYVQETHDRISKIAYSGNQVYVVENILAYISKCDFSMAGTTTTPSKTKLSTKAVLTIISFATAIITLVASALGLFS